MMYGLDETCCLDTTRRWNGLLATSVIVMKPQPPALSQARLSGRDTGDPIGLEEILDSLPCAVVVADRATRVRYRNAAAKRLLPGGSDLAALFSAVRFPGRFMGWPSVVRQVIDASQALELPCSWDSDAPPAPGGLTLTVHCCPLRSVGGRPDGVVIFVEHGSSPAAGEPEEMSRRLASLGKLASRVAHELNNPLDGVLRYINLALRIIGDAPESKVKAYLCESRSGLMRMVQIIGDLLEYSRSTAGQFDDVEISEVIEEAIRSLASAAAERNVVVAADFQGPAGAKVRGGRLYQVLCNLIRNALDAMPHGGRLTVTSGLVRDEIVIRVSDTGVGLPQPLEKVFEPFFTTKPPGQGTGLGLAICKDFIEDMGGTISAANGESGGAIFTVRIPTLPSSQGRNTGP